MLTKTAEKINARFRYDQMRFVFSGSGEWSGEHDFGEDSSLETRREC